MKDMIDRLSKLEGPDWTISCEIISSLISVDDPDAKDFYGSGKDFTASVDAAIALAERVLPGCDWIVSSSRRHDKPFSEVILTAKHGRSGYCGLGVTPAIALCIAILRAKDTSHDL